MVYDIALLESIVTRTKSQSLGQIKIH